MAWKTTLSAEVSTLVFFQFRWRRKGKQGWGVRDSLLYTIKIILYFIFDKGNRQFMAKVYNSTFYGFWICSATLIRAKFDHLVEI